jgi:hypothetical protein
MSINWSKLQTYEDWAKVLRGILERAAQALQDAELRGTVKRDLITFVDESPNWLIRDLDDIAGDSIKDLAKADINEALASIEARTVDLIRLTKSVTSVKDQAQLDAKSLRLEKAKQVVDATTNTVNAIKELKSSLGSGGADKDLDKLATLAMKAIQDLRAAVEAS